MTLWTDLFPDRALISRTYYATPNSGTPTDITAPAGSNILRVSMVGAGSLVSSAPGYGAAFARRKVSCSAGQAFKVWVGNWQYGNTWSNSYLQRVSDSAYLCLAERGKSTGPGLAANSIGDVTRSGGNPSGNGDAGASGSDLADTISLGIGGNGSGRYDAEINYKGYHAKPGGGGIDTPRIWPSPPEYGSTLSPGDGLVCVEFFTEDPGY